MLQANEEGKRGLDDFAVLFRTGRQADALESRFLEVGIPHRVIGQKTYLDAPSVQRALGFFKYVLRGDAHALIDVLSIPAFDPGRAARAALRKGIHKGVLPDALPDAVQEKWDAVKGAADRFREALPGQSPAELIAMWADEFAPSEDVDIARLGSLAESVDTIAELLDVVALGQDGDFVRHGRVVRPDAVTLMTLHASKGLEFPVVFICGAEEGLLPYSDAEVAEERRLFFVGITRGRDEVILTRARSRLRFGERIRPEVSRFASDIPEEVIERIDLRTKRREGADQLSLF